MAFPRLPFLSPQATCFFGGFVIASYSLHDIFVFFVPADQIQVLCFFGFQFYWNAIQSHFKKVPQERNTHKKFPLLPRDPLIPKST